MLSTTSSLSSRGFVPPNLLAANAPQTPTADATRETFDRFVGETFYGQMLASMRKTQEKPAYFHGGRAEEVFQGQMDQLITQELTAATPGSFSGNMFDLFALARK
ncbi:MAG: rod-binding protein [Planctomycetaceae bacterium]|nr:rod-binding protein [Planctomycetaceae bacterium]